MIVTGHPCMSMHAKSIVHSADIIGESPVWDELQKRLLWLDQAKGVVYEARVDEAGGWRKTRQWELGRPLAALVLRRAGGFVLAAGTDILLFDETRGASTTLLSLPVDPELVRLNEAKCDPRGRLWAATLSTDFHSPRAALYRIEPDHTATEVVPGVRVGNGFDWSMDGSTFYFADSMRGGVDAFDFDADRGTLANPRTFVKLERCAPDGLTVDSEGCVWIAAAGAGEVRCYTPQGGLRSRVEIDTPGVTSCTFGGDHGQDLLITSISIRMPDVVLELGIPPESLDNDRPGSGNVFCARAVAGPGKPAWRFEG